MTAALSLPQVRSFVAGILALGIACSLVSFATPRAQASSPVSTSALTQGQIAAIISLLQSFGADQTLISKIQVALGGGVVTPPVPSGTPSGTIAYVVRQGGVNYIYSMNANGTGAKKLTSCGEGECFPSWSFDGTKIAFQRSENGVGIYTMNADGTNVKRLSPTPGQDVRPSFSPDGTKILFTHVVAQDPSGGVPTTEIMTMSATDGSGRATIIPVVAGGGYSVEAHYSPDGKKIVFMRATPGVGQHVYTVDANGTGLKQLTTTGTNGDPHWSPDGSRISFGSNREGGGKLNIFTMKADGSDVKQITHFIPPYEAGDTSWSPDGAYITFEWDVDGKGQSDPNVRAEVWIVASDGSSEPFSTGQACSAVGCAPRWQHTTVATTSTAIASLSATPSSGVAPLNVTFNGNGGGKTAFGGMRVEFGDGTATSAACDAGRSCGAFTLTHKYALGGNFTTRLIALGEGANTTLAQVNVTVASTPMPPVSTTTVATTTPTKATYKGYMDGNLFITTQNITRADALANCKQNASANPARAVRCVWGSEEIYNITPIISTASLTVTPTSGVAPLNVTFSGNGGGRTAFGGARVDFGDGSVGTACDAGSACGAFTLAHTYATAGTYIVRLILVGEGSVITLAQTNVVAKAPTPTLAAYITPQISKNGQTVSLKWDVTAPAGYKLEIGMPTLLKFRGDLPGDSVLYRSNFLAPAVLDGTTGTINGVSSGNTMATVPSHGTLNFVTNYSSDFLPLVSSVTFTLLNAAGAYVTQAITSIQVNAPDAGATGGITGATLSQSPTATPTVYGVAAGTDKVGVVLTNGAGQMVFSSGVLPVVGGQWSVKVTGVAPGQYLIHVIDVVHGNAELEAKFPLTVASGSAFLIDTYSNLAAATLAVAVTPFQVVTGLLSDALLVLGLY